MGDTPFAEAYASVAPEHPVFERCPECGDYTHEAIAMLSVAGHLGSISAINMAAVETPPELVGFFLTVLLSSTVTSLVGMRRSNADVQTVYETVPQIEEMLQSVIDRLPAEIERVKHAAVEAAKRDGVAGSC